MNCMAVETEEGFLAFYERTAPIVFRYLYRACNGERALAEDLTQETFAAALRAWDTAVIDDAQAWVLTVARHKMIDGFRRLERETRAIAKLVRRTHNDAVDVAQEQHVLTCLRSL